MYLYCPGEVFRKTCIMNTCVIVSSCNIWEETYCLWLVINRWLIELMLLVVFVYIHVWMIEIVESGLKLKMTCGRNQFVINEASIHVMLWMSQAQLHWWFWLSSCGPLRLASTPIQKVILMCCLMGIAEKHIALVFIVCIQNRFDPWCMCRS